MKTKLINTILGCSAVLFSLVAIEIFLRVVAPIPYSMEVEYVLDGYLGVRLAPNKTYTLKSGGTCSINNLGFRGTKDLKYYKPENTFRIVVLGGSAAFSYETTDEKTWVSSLEQSLLKKYGGQIEVINAGVPGYSVFESKINYLYQIRRMSPDVVIVYHTWNDMKYFKALDNDLILRRNAFSKDHLKSFLKNYQIAWRFRNFYNQYISPRQAENSYSDSLTSTHSFSPDGQAYKWEKKNFEDFTLLLKSDNVLPVLVTQASLLSVDNVDDPKIQKKVRVEFQGLTHRQILEQWEATSNIIQKVAKDKGALLIDGYSKVPHDLKHLQDHVHLTEAGDQKLGDIIFKELSSNPLFDNMLKGRSEAKSK
jgi:lysophospholipase L1-like esterase